MRVASEHVPDVQYNVICLSTASLTPAHPSLLLLMAVTARRNHWRPEAWSPWMTMTQWGTASAETAWLTTPTVEENSMRTAHLSENILNQSTEVLVARPTDPAPSLHKAGLRLKRSYFKMLSRYFLNSASLALNIEWIAKIRGHKKKMTQMCIGILQQADCFFFFLPRGPGRGEHIHHTHQCEYHVRLCTYCKRMTCTIWVFHGFISDSINCFLYLSTIIFSSVYLYCSFTKKKKKKKKKSQDQQFYLTMYETLKTSLCFFLVCF